mmetsp:Transcript_16509/g.47608  ORF Transcript_16509/g.47608 Transcript_16509/m.47608 type:complete len:380 (-) Transcript_16509:271-1410(-)
MIFSKLMLITVGAGVVNALPILTDAQEERLVDLDSTDSQVSIRFLNEEKSKAAIDGLCSDVWNLPATDASGDTYSCGARIEWKQTTAGGALSLAAAKQFVADEIPDPCGACAGPAVVCTGDRTLAEALQQGCHTVTGDLTDGGASGDVNLPNLRYVGGSISVKGNDNLDTLTMKNLGEVGGSIYVNGNDHLDSLTMENLETVDSWGDLIDGEGIYVNNNEKQQRKTHVTDDELPGSRGRRHLRVRQPQPRLADDEQPGSRGQIHLRVPQRQPRHSVDELPELRGRRHLHVQQQKNHVTDDGQPGERGRRHRRGQQRQPRHSVDAQPEDRGRRHRRVRELQPRHSVDAQPESRGGLLRQPQARLLQPGPAGTLLLGVYLF